MGSAGLLDGTERTRYPNNQKKHSYTPERPASAGPLPIDRGAPTLHKAPHKAHLSGGWGRQGCSMARNAPDTRTTKKNIHTRQRGPLQPVLSRLIGERLPCTKRRTKRTYPADGVGRAARWHGTHQIPEQPKKTFIHAREA